MSKNLERLTSLVVGFYVWMIAVFFGGILLDIAYSRIMNGALSISERTPVYSGISDVLLRLGFVMILAAFGAIAFSWNFSNTRNLFILSLFVVTLEFLAPLFFFPFIQLIEDLNLGPWLRILPGGLASILAFFGLYHYYRQKFNVRSLANT